MEGIWSLLELEEQRDAAVEAYAKMESERREAERRSQKAHARMDELTEELAAFCTRRSRWIRFLQGYIWYTFSCIVKCGTMLLVGKVNRW
eukprot:SAG11_NODE_142_length_14906_cov_8.352333_4_plen_90_part_00